MKKADLNKLEKKALNGHPKSLEEMIDYYFVEKRDLKKALKWAIVGVSYDSPHAMAALGYLFETGGPLERNLDQALYWFCRAEKKGDSNAKAWLAYAYDLGYVVKKDSKKALSLYKEAALLGSVAAQFNLGQIHWESKNPRLIRQAVSWWKKAALGGHVKAMCNLGMAYENGSGIRKSESSAMIWYEKAEKLGDTLAAKNLRRLSTRKNLA